MTVTTNYVLCKIWQGFPTFVSSKTTPSGAHKPQEFFLGAILRPPGPMGPSVGVFAKARGEQGILYKSINNLSIPLIVVIGTACRP